jgi:peptide-methionine (S)-S-oxide reductase
MSTIAVMSLLPVVAGCGAATARDADSSANPTEMVTSEEGVAMNAEPQAEGETAKATFAAGCFWGVEAALRQVKGVRSTSVGYTGGTVENPTYKQVCTDKTGHAEAVEVIYDPSKVSYEDLLKVFWENHDPTTLNRQGPDVGSQYRSAIFYHTPEQKAAAEASKAELEKSRKYRRPIVTEIQPATKYYRAEEYHQQYLEKRGLATCHL